jgi:hypothetical protein
MSGLPVSTVPMDEVMGLLYTADFGILKLQFRSGGTLHETEIPFMQAMFLLSLLKCTQLNVGFPFPDDPRDPNAIPIKPDVVWLKR